MTLKARIAPMETTVLKHILNPIPPHSSHRVTLQIRVLMIHTLLISCLFIDDSASFRVPELRVKLPGLM